MKRLLTIAALCAMLIPSVALGQMATFGITDESVLTASGLTIENQLYGPSSPSGCPNPMLPASAGDVDSMTFRIRFTTTSQPQNIKMRCGLYEYAAQGIFGVDTPPLVDSCARETTYVCNNATETVWVSFPVALGYTVSPSVYAYAPMVMSATSTSWTATLMYLSSTGDTLLADNTTYISSAVPATMAPSTINGARAGGAYVTYTIPSTNTRRPRYLRSWMIRDANEEFAGGFHEVVR